MSEGSRIADKRVLPAGLVRGVLIGAVAVCIYYVAVKGPTRSAFIRWRPQIAEMMNGADAYTKYGFPYPPVMALLLAPLAKLPPAVGMSAWLFLKVLMTLAALRWLVLQQRDAWRRRIPASVPILAMIATTTPIVGDLMHGNINLWILFLVVATWRAFGTGRRWLAGFVLSLAVACKVTPALLVLYFAWKREWKTAATAVLGVAAWLFVFPLAWFAWSHNLYLLERWSGLMIQPYVVEGRAESDVRNQSLAGLFQRLTSPPSAQIAADDGHVDPAVHLASLSAEASRWTWRAIGTSVLGCLWLLTRRPASTTDRRWLEHEFSMVLVAMLLLSERSWKHHYVTILPSFVALFAWIRFRGEASARRRIIIGLTVTAAALPILASQDVLGPTAGDSAVELIQAYGVYAWSAALLVSAHLLARRRLTRGSSSSEQEFRETPAPAST
jgi:alpha-1,2-mannosyltransferase